MVGDIKNRKPKRKYAPKGPLGPPTRDPYVRPIRSDLPSLSRWINYYYVRSDLHWDLDKLAADLSMPKDHIVDVLLYGKTDYNYRRLGRIMEAMRLDLRTILELPPPPPPLPPLTTKVEVRVVPAEFKAYLQAIIIDLWDLFDRMAKIEEFRVVAGRGFNILDNLSSAIDLGPDRKRKGEKKLGRPRKFQFQGPGPDATP